MGFYQVSDVWVECLLIYCC